MAEALTDHLLRSLEGLLPSEFETFKFKLQTTGLEKEQPRIQRGQLHETTPVQVADLLLTHYGHSSATLLTLQILRAMNLNLLAENLQRALASEAPAGGASRPGGSRRTPDVSESDGPRGLGARQRELSLPARRALGPGRPQSPGRQSPARQGSAQGSAQGSGLRRNASSAGRLQGFSGVTLRLRETVQGADNKRPKSLESNFPPGDMDPALYYALQAQEKRKTAELAGAQGRRVAQQGPRHPEHAKAPEGAAVRSAPCRASPPKDPAAGVAATPGWPQDRLCPICCAQEGGLSVPEACGCSAAPGACLGCQASLPGKRGQGWELQENPVTSLSPKTLLQCEQHPRQAQLLFCEDHRELICLVCSLSRGHRGHHICRIDEAARGDKEQIQKQLEHLKQLRKSGEEQRCQGDQKTANFLKDTEIQKQRLRGQLQGLCRFLEQQEQLFMAWLDHLGQNIDQLRGAYNTRVSRDIARLDEQIGALEAKQCQPEWALMQDIRGTLQSAQTLSVPEPWAIPPDMTEKLHLLYHKSEFVERSLKWFSETLRKEMGNFSVPERTGAQAGAQREARGHLPGLCADPTCSRRVEGAP